MGSIAERVERCRAGTEATQVARVASGWVVMGDPQVLPGYCLLLPDPVVPSLNDLVEPARTAYLRDLARLGDAVLAATGARRINYEILGNLDPELHAHVFPRYAHEPDERRRAPVWFYDWSVAEPFAAETHGALREAIARALAGG